MKQYKPPKFKMPKPKAKRQKVPKLKIWRPVKKPRGGHAVDI